MTGHDMAAHGSGVAAMVVMGLLTSVVAPLVVLAGRRRAPRVAAGTRTGGALAILLGFTVLHAGLVLLSAGHAAGATAQLLLHAVLFAGAVLFWLPVLGRGATRLGDAARSVYLFLACPLLDLAALALVVRGDEAGGIAMIVGMLPIALAAVVLTWRWIAREERASSLADRAAAAPVAGGRR